MTLKQLRYNYIYRTDKEQYGVDEYWEEMKPNKDGKYIGDCESVAITLKRNNEEFKDWDYYWCRLNGGGHCILSNGELMVDNNTREVWTLDKFNDTWNITELRPYRWYELVFKFTQAKLLNVWFKLRR